MQTLCYSFSSTLKWKVESEKNATECSFVCMWWPHTAFIHGSQVLWYDRSLCKPKEWPKWLNNDGKIVISCLTVWLHSTDQYFYIILSDNFMTCLLSDFAVHLMPGQNARSKKELVVCQVIEAAVTGRTIKRAWKDVAHMRHLRNAQLIPRKMPVIQ